MTDFDHARLDRVLPSIQGAPDWGDVLSRSRVRQGRHRRHLFLAAAAALVAVIGTATAIGGVRIFVLDKGFIGLPPRGATPSAPESGELVLRWQGGSATHARRHRRGFHAPYAETLVYDDGRIIWQRDGLVPEGPSGYLEQRLTPEGVELLRAEVVGLVDRSRGLLETVPADDDPVLSFGRLTLFVPGAYGSGWGSVEVRDRDRFVRLQWHHEIADDQRLDDPWANALKGTIATPEQLSALRRVDALLTDSASVLPSSAWAVREVRAYVASHYAVCISNSTSKDASQLLSLLPARAAELLRDRSWTRTWLDSYCSKLTTDKAREVANAVSGLPRHRWPLTLIYDLAEGVDPLDPTTIEFDPYFPDGRFLLHGGGR